MVSFETIQQVKLYLRKGKYFPNASSTDRRAVRRASQFYFYKDGLLLRKYKGRYLRAVSSQDQVDEIMLKFHDNNNHAGRRRMVPEIMSLYHWVGVRDSVKDWIQKCDVCKAHKEHQAPEITKSCLAYGCDTSSFLHPELTFHRFPKSKEQRQHWLVVAQRDEGSVRRNSFLCSRHFEPDCFQLTEDGQEVLRSDAVPTIIGLSRQEDESRPADPEEPLFHPSSLEDLLTCAAATAKVCPGGFSAERNDPPHEEHQYSLRVPDPHPANVMCLSDSRKNTYFTTYNLIARYLSHRTLPQWTKTNKNALRKMAKRFALIDGVLMYTLRPCPVRVPRNREEVNSILQQFHDNHGHYGHRTCFQSMTKHYYWGSMGKDLHYWISRCSTCMTRTKRKWLRCSIANCTNCCGPVERKLGLTFHRFPMDRPSLLERWVKATGRRHWYPPLWSSVCSVHFTDDCFDRSGGRVELRPDAVPTVKTHGNEVIQSQIQSQGQSCAEAEETAEQEETFFSKFDAVELYISSQTYPPGLNYVEKNTFRRFCKKYLVKDQTLFIRRRDRVVPVLRNRAQVNEALKEYHDELNHLEVKKCLRLLSERCFWKTMRSDISKWISKCSICCWKNNLKKHPTRNEHEKLPPPQPGAHSDPEFESEVWSENDAFRERSDNESESETAMKRSQPEQQKKLHGRIHNKTGVQHQIQDCVSTSKQTLFQTQPQVMTRLKTQAQIQDPPQIKDLSQVQQSAQIQAKNKVLFIILNRQPEAPVPSAPKPSLSTDPDCADEPGQKNKNAKRVLKQKNKKHKPDEPEIQMENSDELNYQHEEQVQTSLTKRQKLQRAQQAKAFPGNNNKPEVKRRTLSPATNTSPPMHSSRGRPLKRKVFMDEVRDTKRVQNRARDKTMDLMVNLEDSQTITESLRETRKTDSVPPVSSTRPLAARVVVQQCSRAKVKTCVGLDGGEQEHAQIREGLLVYVCFFDGATEDITLRIADSVMNTQFFRVPRSRQQVSVLELPGGVLLVPQESLGWERGPHRSMRSRGVCKAWQGSRLFSSLVSHCREMLFQRGAPGGTVEQGVYGQRQEIELTSSEPMSHVLEF